MNSGDDNFELTYIWQAPDWPAWRFDQAKLAEPLARVHRAQGHLMGRMSDLGLSLRDQASLEVVTADVMKTSEIEGKRLNLDTVRSSIARRLGTDNGALAPADRHVDGVVEMILDATLLHEHPLTPARLFAWHAALFPTAHSGIAPIRVGGWRDDANGPMQVVSGALGRQKVHFEAPPATRLADEAAQFLHWFNRDSGKWAAIARCSPDTALRDINELLARGVLKKSVSGGRSTSYEVCGKEAAA